MQFWDSFGAGSGNTVRPLVGIAVTLVLASVSTPASAWSLNAYIANSGDNTVSVIDTASGTVVGNPIAVGDSPVGLAVTPDGHELYVTNQSDNTVSVIDTARNAAVGDPIPVGGKPRAIAITPDGHRAYIANTAPAGGTSVGPGSVSVVDTASNQVTATITPFGQSYPSPTALAITPDGSRLYVLYYVFSVGGGGVDVDVIDTASDARVTTIFLGFRSSPASMVITPDGSKIYVAYQEAVSSGGGFVAVIDIASNKVVGTPIPVEQYPGALAVSPDGSKVYVAEGSVKAVSVIDTTTNMVLDGAILLTGGASGLALSPDGRNLYVTDPSANTVSIFDTYSAAEVGGPIPVGKAPLSIAIQPGLRFAGVPGHRDCKRLSILALAGRYDGLEDAAEALHYPDKRALWGAISTFCGDNDRWARRDPAW